MLVKHFAPNNKITMSNKSTKDSKQFQNMSFREIRKLIDKQKEELKKDYKEFRERRKLIKQYKKLTQAREKVRQGIDIKKELKKPPPKKVKSFQEYFEECKRNKKIPEDTPPYLRKALERAILEYNKKTKLPSLLDYDEEKHSLLENEKEPEKEIVIKKEKSAFVDFANKYTIEGIPGVTPLEYFEKINKTLKDFFTNHRNIKLRLILICKMKKITFEQKKNR